MEITNQSPSSNLQILTPNGFKPFDGVKRYWHEQCVEVRLSNGKTITTAKKHKFIVNDKCKYSIDLQPGDPLSGSISVVSTTIKNDPQYFYDPVNVSGGSIFSHDDGLTSHNTFVGTSDTLIASDKLLGLQSENPIYQQDNVRVFDRPDKDSEYMMFVDVAKGRGLDYSTFTIIDITSKPFKQVAVYQDNMVSPLLFPDIIYKYAKTYNDAYVIIESNDAGQVVCNGLYYELEYENVFVESSIKANSIGVNMTRKIKRIGCSNLKDLIEEGQLLIRDSATIVELSTFTAQGQSFAASDGNHDDLVMNLVLFGWFATTQLFAEFTDIDVRKMIYEEQIKMIEDDMVPFGEIDDGLDDRIEVIDGDVWTTSDDPQFGAF